MTAFFKPVVKGPWRHPNEVRTLPSPVGFGKARRGGPADPKGASWMWVAVAAGDRYSPVTPTSLYKENAGHFRLMDA